MSEVRPYRLNSEEMIDLNLVTRISLFKGQPNARPDEKWQVVLTMYYADPITLYFPSNARAVMEMNKLFQVWQPKKSEEEDLSSSTDKLDEMFDKVIKSIDNLTDRVTNLEQKFMESNPSWEELRVQVVDSIREKIHNEHKGLLYAINEAQHEYPGISIELGSGCVLLKRNQNEVYMALTDECNKLKEE